MELDALRIAKLLSDLSDTTLIAKQGAPLDINYQSDARSAGIHFETIPFRYFFSPSIIKNARRIIKEKKIKNVIFFGASEMRSLYFAFLGLDINLIIRHGTTKSTPKKDLFHRLIYSQVNWHIAICQHLKSNVLRIIPMGKKTQVKVIYSSLRHMPDSVPNRKLTPSSPIKLLYIGRIADGKGLIDAIKACEIFYTNGMKFEFKCVGDIDPNFKNTFMETLSSVPYKEHIELPGFCSDVAKFLKASDIFVFPSKGEGLSNSFIEALSYGLT
jgi:glycosyltransferase involved in cell wall biosynthesis